MLRTSPTSLLVAALFMATLPGCCLPRTIVKKNPNPSDTGIRYYRPKPYLMIKPLVAKDGVPIPGYVSIETTTLPDYSEEYSIHIKPGLGTNDTNITLTDGWNLTGLNVNIDSQFDENLKAIADVAKAVPTSGVGKDSQMAVGATNVPLGLYEAVISKGSDCKKRLYGFRYVGFMPYASCPLESCGVDHAHCGDGQVYGLVFDQEANAMVFKLLHETRQLVVKDEVSDGSVLDDFNNEAEDNPAEELPPVHLGYLSS